MAGSGATAADGAALNQSLPSAAAPNNVLAAYWTNLDPTAGGALRIGMLINNIDT